MIILDRRRSDLIMFNKYYSLKKILSKNADYNLIIGERSNGKTYATLLYALKQYLKNGSEFAYIRRWSDDVRGKRASQIFGSLNSNNEIVKLTNGEYSIVNYYNGKFYLANYDEKLKKYINAPSPCGYTFSLTAMEHDKSNSYPDVNTIIFDEFLTRRYYLPDEFIMFMNVISTIVRHRDNVKIFMLGNTVNKYCPYFKEMGLTKIKDMKQNTIDVYTYGDSNLTVAVEYCGTSFIKGSNKYFAFGNPKLKMITGGTWEIDIYPHLPYKYLPKDILFTYFIKFNGDILQCEIIQKNDEMFTYIHQKTTPIKDVKNDLIFSLEYSPRGNIITNINKPTNKLESKIWYFFAKNKVFYQDNTVGEIVRNYLIQCGKIDV